jgi:hypothetical protein
MSHLTSSPRLLCARRWPTDELIHQHISHDS